MNTQTCLHSCHRSANFCLSTVNGLQESFHHRATPSTDENMKKKSKKMKKNFKKLKKFYANKLFLPCIENQRFTFSKAYTGRAMAHGWRSPASFRRRFISFSARTLGERMRWKRCKEGGRTPATRYTLRHRRIQSRGRSARRFWNLGVTPWIARFSLEGMSRSVR